jgi:autotransporter-associated beta strand protein
MKTRARPSFLSLGFIALCCSAAQAQTNLIWDSNGVFVGVAGGSGTWATTGSRWWNGTSNQNWDSGANAIFAVSGGTVTLGTAVNVAGLGFDVGGYTISGAGSINFIYLEGNVITTTTGTATIAVSLNGIGGFSKTGAGTLVLSGTNNLAGSIDVTAGTLRLANGAAVSNTSAITLTNVASAVLDLNGTNETIGSLAGGGASGGNVSLGGATLTTGGDATSTTFAGSISGTGGVTKIGGGTLTLTGTNSFSGALAIENGAIAITAIAANGSSSPLGSGSQLNLGGTGTTGELSFTGAAAGSSNRMVSLSGGGGRIRVGAADLTLSGVIGGSAGLVKDGSGTLVLSGSNTYSGATTITAGILRLSGGAALPDATALTLANTTGAALDLNGTSETIGSLAGGGASGGNVTLGSATLTTGGDNSSTIFGGAISGSGGLAKTGSGMLILSGSNSYSGATTLSAGTLRLSGGSALGDGSAVTLANTTGAILDLNGTSETIGSLAGGGTSGGNVALGGGILTTGGNNSSTTFAGVISGSGGLTKTGGGMLILSNSNSYSGATTISAGTLRLSGGSALDDTSAVTLANTSGANLDLNGTSETIGSLAGGGTTGGNVILGSSTLTTGANSSSTIFGGAISGTGGLTKTGSGVLSLTNTNTFTGALAISAGTLRLSSASAVPNGVIITLADFPGASLDLDGYSRTVAALSGGGASGGNVTLGAANLTINNGSAGSFAGAISGSGGFIKTGNAVFTLSGTNTYSGATTVSSGTLRVAGGAAIPTASALVLANASTFDLNNSHEDVGSLAGLGFITLGNATLTIGGDNTSTSATVNISGTGGLAKTGSGTQTLSGSNSFSGPTTISGGTLRVSGGSSLSDTAALTLANNPGVTLDLTTGESIGSLAGGGASGGNVMTAGILTTGGDNTSTTFGGAIAGAGGLTKIGAGHLELSGNHTYSGATTLSGGGIRLTGSGTLPASSAVVLDNSPGLTLDLNGITQSIGSLAGGGTSGGNVLLGGANLTIGGNSTGTAFSGTISGSGSLTKIGSGALTLAGTNAYSGSTAISSGVLSISGGTALPDTTAVTIANTAGATLELYASETIGSFAGGGATGGGISILNSATLTAGGDHSSTTFAGTISGSGGLTKTGGGVLALTGANTFSGNLAIEAGAATTPDVADQFSTSPLGKGTAFSLGAATTAGRLIYTGAGADSTNRGFTLNAGGGIIENAGGGTLTLSGPLGGSGGLTKTGAGLVELLGTGSYGGATMIEQGLLRVASGNSIPNLSQVTISATPGTGLELGYSETIGSLAGGGTVNLNASTLTFGGNNLSTTYSGTITGTGSLTKSGSGSTALTTSSSFSGGVLIDSGMLSAGAANVLGNGPLSFSSINPATLQLNGFSTTVASISASNSSGSIQLGGGDLTVTDNSTAVKTFGGSISGSGGLIKQGIHTMVLSGSNTYGGSTRIEAGQIRANAAAAIPATTAVVLTNTGSASLRASYDLTIASLAGGGALGGNVILDAGNKLTTGGNNTSTIYSGAISGTGSWLTKVGSGTLTLEGFNTYTGPTTVTAGILRLRGGAALSDASNLNLTDTAGVALELDGSPETIGWLSGGGANGGNVVLGASTLTVNTPSGSGTTFSGAISGGGGLTLSGPGSLDLAGTNTYTGTTTINGGWCSISSAQALPVNSPVVLANAAATTLSVGPLGEIQLTSLSGGGPLGGNLSLNANHLMVGANGLSTSFGGIISGTGAVTKTGTGSLDLLGANTWTGTTTIEHGQLRLSGGAAVDDSSAVVLADAADASLILLASETLHSLSGGGTSGGSVILSDATLTISGEAAAPFAGTISGTGGLAYTGTTVDSQFVLTGQHSYSGTTFINRGNLILAGNGALPSATAVVFGSFASLTLQTAAAQVGSLSGGAFSTINLGTAVLHLGANGSSSEFLGTLTGSGGLTKTGAGGLLLDGARLALTGTISLAGGTTSVLVPNADVAFPGTVDLSSTAGNQLTLQAVTNGQPYGALSIGALSGGGSSGGTVAIPSNIWLAVGSDDSSSVFAGTLTGSGHLRKEGSGTLTLTGSSQLTGSVEITGGRVNLGGGSALADTLPIWLQSGTLGLLDSETIGALTGGGTADLGSHVLTVGGGNATSSFNGTIIGSGGLIKTGSGTFTLENAVTYTGPTTIRGGILDSQGALPDTGAVVLADAPDATLKLTGVSDTIGSLSGVGNVDLASGAQLRIGGDNSSCTFDGIIFGNAGSLAKTGAGILTLTGNNTYGGATIIEAGTLRLAGAGTLSGATAVSLANVAGAALDLNGNNLTISQISGGGAAGGSVLLGDGVLSVNSNVALTTRFDGIIGGSGGFTKDGAHTLELAGSNTYTGLTTVRGGTLRLLGSNTLADSGSVTLTNSSTLELGADETIGSLTADSSNPLLDLHGHTLSVGADNTSTTYAGRLSGPGSLVKQGTGTLTIATATAGYAATLHIQQGTVTTAATDAFYFCPVVLDNATGATFDLGNLDQRIDSLAGGGSVALGTARLTVGGADSTTFSGTLAGTGGLTKAGGGTLTLAGANTFSGSTQIIGGTLRLQGGQTIPDLTGIEFNGDFTTGATLDLAGSTETVGSLGRINGLATVALGGGTLVVGSSNTWSVFDGVIAGPGNVTKVGSSWLDLGGANTFDGALTITQGSVRVPHIANVGIAQPLGSGNQLVLGSASAPGTLSYMTRDGVEATDRAIWLNAGGGVISLENAGSQLAFNGVISGPGALTLTGASNSIQLGGSNTYAGPTRILAGGVRVSGGQAIPDSSEVTLGNNASLWVAESEVIGPIVAPGSAVFVVGVGATLTLGSPVTNYACGFSVGGTLALGGNDVSINLAGGLGIAGTLWKTGSGTLIISGDASASAGSTIALDGGTLRLEGQSALPTFGTVVLADTAGTTLDLNGLTRSINRLEGGGADGGNILLGTATLTVNSDAVETLSYGGAISGSGGLVKDGAHTLVLGGANTYTGMTHISRGRLKIAAGGSLAPAAMVVCGLATTFELEAGTLTIGSLQGEVLSELHLGTATLTTGGDNNSTAFHGTITGAGGLTKEGSGSFWLARTNSFTGPVTVNGGTLVVEAQYFDAQFSALPDGNRVTLADAAGVTLSIRTDETIGSLAGGGGSGGTVTIRSATTLRAGSDNSSATFGGNLTGLGNFYKQGTGTLTLTGMSDLTGMIAVADGTLRLAGGTALPDSAIISLYGTGVLELAASETLGGLAVAGRVELGASTLTVGGNDKSSSYGGVIAGAGGLTKIGSGTFIVAGPNTYTGLTTITGGTLDCQTGTIPDAGAVVLANVTGAALRLNATTETIGSLTGGGGLGGRVDLTNGGHLRVGADNTSTTYDGTIFGQYGEFTKIGTGTLTLTGQQTYTGVTMIEAGTLRLAGAGALPSAGVVDLADVAGVTLDLNGRDCSIGRLVGGGTHGGNVILGTGTLTVDSETTATFAYGGSISGAGGITKDGAHTLELAGTHTYTGLTTIRGGTLRLAGSNVLPDSGRVSMVNNSILELTTDETIGSLTATSSGQLVDLHGHTLTLGGDNTSTPFAGRWSGPGTVVKQGSGVLTVSTAATTAATLRIEQGTVATTTQDAFYFWPVDLSNAPGASFDLGNIDQRIESLSGGGGVALGSARLTVGGEASTTFSGTLAGTGGLTKSGGGTLTLAGTNTFSGTTYLTGGALRLQGGQAIVDTGTVIFNGNAILDLAGSTETIGTLNTQSSQGEVALGGGTLTIGAGNQFSGFDGVISGSGNLTKTGTGTAILRGASTFVGTVTIAAGTLQVTTLGNQGLAQPLGQGGALVFGSDTTAGTLFLWDGTPSLEYSSERSVWLNPGGGIISLVNSLLTLSGPVGGPGDLTVPSHSAVILTGTNTFAGTTLVVGGSLILAGGNALPDTNDILLSTNGSLRVADNETIGTLAGADSMTVIESDATLSLGGTNAAITYGGNLLIEGGLRKSGSGELRLGGDGSSSTNGHLWLDQGTLRVQGGSALGDFLTVHMPAGNSTSMTLDADETIGLVSGGQVFLGTHTLTLNGLNSPASDVVCSTSISGSGGLTKDGWNGARLILTGVNDYTGATTLRSGRLRVEGGHAIADTSAVILVPPFPIFFEVGPDGETIGSLTGQANSTLVLEGNLTTGADNASSTFGGTLAGDGTLVKTGTGTLNLTGLNPAFQGAVNLQGGEIQLSEQCSFPVSTFALTNQAVVTLRLNNAVALGGLTGNGTVQTGTYTLTVGTSGISSSYAGTITGAGSLTKDGAGTFTLRGSNSYGGVTLIRDGTLRTEFGQALPASSALEFGPAGSPRLETDVLGASVASLIGGGNATIAGSLTLGGGNGDSAFYGRYTGLLSKTGTGTFFCGGIAEPNSGIQIAGGTVRTSGGAAIADDGYVSLSAAGATLDLAGTSETLGSLWGASGSRVTLGSATLTVRAAEECSFAGVISGSGSLVKDGPGTLRLEGANTYTGPTVINEGALYALPGYAIPAASVLSLANVAGAKAATNIGLEVAGLTGGGPLGGSVELGGALDTLTINGSGSHTFGGVIVNGSLRIIGGGTQTLTGTNTFRGTTTIANGTLCIGPGGSLHPQSSVLLTTHAAGPSRLDLDGNPLTIASLASSESPGCETILGSATLTVGAPLESPVVYGGKISGSGDVVMTGPGLWVLTGTNTFTGQLRVTAGAVSLNSGTAIADTAAVVADGDIFLYASETIGSLAGGGLLWAYNASTLTVGANHNSTTFSGKIWQQGATNPVKLVKVGTGTLTLTNQSDFTGETRIDGGTLRLAEAGALSPATSIVLAADAAATLDLNGCNLSARSLEGGSNSQVMLGAATLSLTVPIASSGIQTFHGVISGGGGLSVTRIPLLLDGANTYQGPTILGDNARLILSKGQAISDQSRVSLAHPYAQLQVGGSWAAPGSSETIGSLEGSGSVIVEDATLTTGADNTSTTLSGGLSGNGGLTKIGAGMFTLTGNSYHSGPTTVAAGTLILGGTASIATSALTTVAGPATLAGSGTTGDMAVNGTLKPGMPGAIGTLTTQALNLAAGANLLLDVSSTAAAPATDRVITHGYLTISTSSLLALQETGPNDKIAAGTKLTLIDYSGHNWNGGTFVGLPNHGTVTLGSNTFVIQYDDTSNGSQSGQFVTLTAANDPYTDWAAAHGMGGAGKFDDSDGDGVSNIVEFALAGDPANAASRGHQQLYTRDASNQPGLLLTLLVRSNAPDFTGFPAPASDIDGIRYRIQGSLNLTDQFQAPVQPTTLQASGLPAPPTGYVYRSFRLTGTSARGFLRVAVEALP